jgi:signal transduction histidine kinase
MKLGLRNALGLVAGYGVVMAVFALGVERSLDSLGEQLSAATVRLLAREQANLVVERSLETLHYPDEDSRRRLHQRIADLTLLSEVVTSLAVVDRDGRVVASEDPGFQPRLAPAAMLFGRPPQARLEPGGTSFLRGGDYVVLVPLVEAGVLAGYLRVGLHSERIASLYEVGRSRLVVFGLLGLAAVAALGVFLQLQLSRGTASLAAALEGSPPRRALTPSDEFARVLLRASRMKGALDEALRQSERRGLQVGALARRLKVGVVLLGRDLEVDQVSMRALEILACTDEASFRAAWEGLRPVVRAALAGPPSSSEGGWAVSLEPSPGKRVQADVQKLEGLADDYLVLLSDPHTLEAFEADGRLARQLEGLGRVYRMMAHELRAPLSAMMINLDLLHESLAAPEGPEPEQRTRERRYVGVLRDELNRLNRSLYGILTEAVPEEPPRDFDLTASLADLIALLSAQARRQDVEVETRLGGAPLAVRGYPDRLRQVFLNVAVNALEAMPRGGRLTVEARRDGAQALVALRDTGPGIRPETLARLFDADSSTKEGGSGIGLCVARALVELHGGQIRVESDVGRGTDVLVSLPLAAAGS